MDGKTFWGIIDQTSTAQTHEAKYELLFKALEPFDSASLMDFTVTYMKYMNSAAGPATRAIAELISGDPISSEVFRWFLDCLIAAGERIYLGIISSPQTVITHFLLDNYCEKFYRLTGADIIEQRKDPYDVNLLPGVQNVQVPLDMEEAARCFPAWAEKYKSRR